MTTPNRFLFVYGTLRAGSRHHKHDELTKQAHFVGRGYAHGELFDLGDYPGIVFSQKGCIHRTIGEVYELDPESMAECWDTFDEYEGCGIHDSQPHKYSRCLGAIHLEDGRKVEAWIYALNRLPEWATPIPGGDYLAWSRLKAKEAALV